MIKIGHRGAAGYKLENTLASFAKAIELGVDFIELDIHLCASGELVVFHDYNLIRLLNIKQDIYTASLAQIQSYKLSNGECIPTLIEALDLINKRAKINIEIKHISSVLPLIKLLSSYVIDKGYNWDDFILSSFDNYAIQLAKKLEPKVYIGALTEGIIIGYAKFAKDLGCYSLHQSIDYINSEIVEDAHRRGLQLYAYTCNTDLQITLAYKLGVDGIISDFPDNI